MKYVAFLRAINVGGHAIIKMTDLKKMFESAGQENVQTYIQSGNVIFESNEKEVESLAKRIEHQLEKAAPLCAVAEGPPPFVQNSITLCQATLGPACS